MAITALKRTNYNNIIVFPDQINFGHIEIGKKYQTKIIIKNNDYLLQRVNIRPPFNNSAISVLNLEGPIAPGISKVNLIRLCMLN